MKAPLRFDKVLSDRQWDAAFGRQSSVEEVLQYVVDHWSELQASGLAEMKFSSSEPKITKYFGHSLYKNARTRGITGLFSPERQHSDVDEVNRTLTASGRSDISYYSDRVDPPLEFVLEFKKMKHMPGGSQSRLSYCRDGVKRFVDAIYARDTDFGFMVSLVEDAGLERTVLEGLVRAIQQPDMEQLLRSIHDASGRSVVTAPLKFKQSRFETRHARDHVPRPDVLLGHLVFVHQ